MYVAQLMLITMPNPNPNPSWVSSVVCICAIAGARRFCGCRLYFAGVRTLNTHSRHNSTDACCAALLHQLEALLGSAPAVTSCASIRVLDGLMPSQHIPDPAGL